MFSPFFLDTENDAMSPKMNKQARNSQPSPPFSLSDLLASKTADETLFVLSMWLTTMTQYRKIGASAAAKGSRYHFSRLKRMSVAVVAGITTNINP